MSLETFKQLELATSEVIDKVNEMFSKRVEKVTMRFDYCDPKTVVITLHANALGFPVREEVRAGCPLHGVDSGAWAQVVSMHITNMMKCSGRFTIGTIRSDHDEGYWQIPTTLTEPVLI